MLQLISLNQCNILKLVIKNNRRKKTRAVGFTIWTSLSKKTCQLYTSHQKIESSHLVKALFKKNMKRKNHETLQRNLLTAGT